MKYQLVLFDVDSTLIEQEVIDLLALRTPHGEKVIDITRRAMSGELDFDAALRERVLLLKDLPKDAITEILSEITFSPGALELLDYLRQRNILVGAVSGGFLNVLNVLFRDLHLDFLQANTLEVRDGLLTGKTVGPIINRQAKAEALKSFAQRCGVAIEATVAVGDGSNDVDMVSLAGLGVSYRGKEILNAAADVVIQDNRLDSLIQYL